MQTTLVVLDDPADVSLLSLYEARLGLNIFTASSTLDDQLEQLIRWSSDEIAVNCNRVLGKQRVQETFREVNDREKRLYVAAYPIDVVESITEKGSLLAEDVDFEVDSDSGTLIRLNQVFWNEPVVVTYSGGYDLPKEAPDALKQATILLTRESYYASLRGDASVRQVSHKESRVAYFDPMRSMGGAGGRGGGGGATPARRAIDDLIQAYTRFAV